MRKFVRVVREAVAAIEAIIEKDEMKMGCPELDYGRSVRIHRERMQRGCDERLTKARLRFDVLNDAVTACDPQDARLADLLDDRDLWLQEIQNLIAKKRDLGL